MGDQVPCIDDDEGGGNRAADSQKSPTCLTTSTTLKMKVFNDINFR